MKTERNILLAFILNFCFSILEFIGGIFINSVAIATDAIHDFGDALSILLSFFLEKKSKKEPDLKYTYGYVRYSVLGAFITTVILVIGSSFVIVNSVNRLFHPVEINYDGMIIFAIFGTLINFIAFKFTHEKESLNQKAVNLHMLEDVLGWIIVLIGSIVMKFTNISLIDALMSLALAVFILLNTLTNLKEILDLFLEKVPSNISVEKVMNDLKKIKGIDDIHHMHIWSMDENNIFATMHVVTNSNSEKIKEAVRESLKEMHINHVTIEIENTKDTCQEQECSINTEHHHHHH